MPLSRLLAVLVCCAASLWAADDLDSQMKSLIDTYSLVEQNAADPISSEQAFYQGAIPGLLRRLDPHSIFFDPGQFEQLQKLETSTQKGFGTVVSLLPGRVIVLQTLPGTPSAKAGLSPGDEILGINGYEIARLDTEQLQQLLGEARQRQAELFVKRPGSSRILRFTMTPAELQTPPVERAFFVAAGIGYIRVTNFEESTPRLIQEAVEKLGGANLKGLVLDLRNNPGGLLTAAVDTASLFLKPGLPIVTVRGRNVPEKTDKVKSSAMPYEFKLAILVNEKTASASEIVTGAMQDHDRATVLGVPSFGKGLVQSVFPLSGGTGLALTTALYYTPSGRSIQKPLDASQFELAGTTAHPNGNAKVFHTDNGRAVTGGGGIQPDFVVYPPAMNRLRIALEASGSFPNYATEYLSSHKVTPEFEVSPQTIDQFKAWLSERGIQPGVSEWSLEREFVETRLKTEIFNQALGVEKGDEVEIRHDPVVLKAIDTLQ
ncbi:MAG TPA: S41 family peptidase [Bryobacteraceae bacterium]|nr:S41 family peptidase [Bryobacteraceae bacterium]